MSKAATLKPFHLEDKKNSDGSVSEATVARWENVILRNIRKEDMWKLHVTTTWDTSKVHKGFEGDTKEKKAEEVESMLAYVAQYAPEAIFRDLTKRCDSLKEVWTTIREWAGVKIKGSKHQQYNQLRQSYVHGEELSATDFFYQLRNAKEDCLLSNDSKVSFKGKKYSEVLTPCLESDVVLDWLMAVGGTQLTDQVFRVFSKDLEEVTLADLRLRILDNLPTLMAEAESTLIASQMMAKASIGKVSMTWTPSRDRAVQGRSTEPRQSWKKPQTSSKSSLRPPGVPRSGSRTFNPKVKEDAETSRSKNVVCRVCQALNRNSNHSTSQCFYRDKKNRRAFYQAAFQVEGSDIQEEEFTSPDYTATESSEEEELKPSRKSGKSVNRSNKYSDNLYSKHHISDNVLKIAKVNIYESQILAVLCGKTPVYVTLDGGAETSLILLAQAKRLGLDIRPTRHRCVQVDGATDLPVLGEVHTTFTRSDVSLKFDALVVDNLGADILGGANFIFENDIIPRMAKGTIQLGESVKVQSTPSTIAAMDKQDRCVPAHSIVVVSRKVSVHPGDPIQFSVPASVPLECEVLAEPNLQEASDFFTSRVVQVSGGKFSVNNETTKFLDLKKNCKAVIIRSMQEDCDQPSQNIKAPSLCIPVPVSDILKEMSLDDAQTMTQTQRQDLINSVKKHKAVFQKDLPGYNHYYGPVYATLEFSGKSRPQPQKVRKPSYGAHGQLLFGQKCVEMQEQGVLADPAELGVQPILINNSWIVKKNNPETVKKPIQQCDSKDVRTVVGFDNLNKWLQEQPGEVTKPEQIYGTIANWRYMGEMDMRDSYYNIPFDTRTSRARKKLAYLCIKTPLGVRCYTRAAMGLLGSDKHQDALTDKMFGDLVIKGKLCKIADNLYFGAQTIKELQELFEEILTRCEKACVRIKPSKVKMNIKSAEILGLHWQEGKLSPSPHKLDPLAACDPPKTVRALRSFLGGVRFAEICLKGPQLAAASQLLDKNIPAERSGKELITWSPELLQSFQAIQNILKDPLKVTIPRRGDTVLLASDACTSLPACGVKMILQRPGTDGFLTSFNWGTRLPARVRAWEPCEVEAYSLSHGVKKLSYWIQLTQKPGIVLVDSKPVYQCFQKMTRGEFSSSRIMQDLLANLSSKNLTVQLMSAKLPSPLLTMVDFSSRHPVQCQLEACRVCQENEVDTRTTYIGGAAHIRGPAHLASAAGWRDIQQTCPDLRRAHALLTAEGSKLSPKVKGAQDLRSYLRECTVNKEGLLVVKKPISFQATPTELIVIPQAYVYNCAKVLHVKFNHPSHAQLKMQFGRHYFALRSEKALKYVWEACEFPCQANRILPKETMTFKTETLPDRVGSHFSADVIQEAKQKILIARENLTSYTATMKIPNQLKTTLRDNLLILLSRCRLGQQGITCRVDGHSSLKSLSQDQSLTHHGIFLEVGHSKNKNSTAIVDKACRELREELVKLQPKGGPVSDRGLALATEQLNNRLRHTNRSALELWLARDQVSGENLSLKDTELMASKEEARTSSHKKTAKYESRGAPEVKLPTVKPGMLVYIKSDKSKSKARESYAVLSVDNVRKEVQLQKFPLDHFQKHILTVQLQNVFITSSAQKQLPLKRNAPISREEEETGFQQIEKPFEPRIPKLCQKPSPGLNRPRHRTSSSSESESESDLDVIESDSEVGPGRPDSGGSSFETVAERSSPQSAPVGGGIPTVETPQLHPTPLRRPGTGRSRQLDLTSVESGTQHQRPPLHHQGSAERVQQGGPHLQVSQQGSESVTDPTSPMHLPDEQHQSDPAASSSPITVSPFPILGESDNSDPEVANLPHDTEAEGGDVAGPACSSSSFPARDVRDIQRQGAPRLQVISPPLHILGSAEHALQGGPSHQVMVESDDDLADLLSSRMNPTQHSSQSEELGLHLTLSISTDKEEVTDIEDIEDTVDIENIEEEDSERNNEADDEGEEEDYRHIERIRQQETDDEVTHEDNPPYQLVQPKSKRKGALKAQDMVLYFSRTSQRWEKVKITGKFGGDELYKAGSYKWSFTTLDGNCQRRGYFHPSTQTNTYRWGVLRGPDTSIDFSRRTIIFPNNVDSDETMLLDSTQHDAIARAPSYTDSPEEEASPPLRRALSLKDLEMPLAQRQALIRNNSYPQHKAVSPLPGAAHRFLVGLSPGEVYQRMFRGAPIPGLVKPRLHRPLVRGCGTWMTFPSGHKVYVTAGQLSKVCASGMCDIQD